MYLSEYTTNPGGFPYYCAATDAFCSFHPGYLTAERLAKAKKLKIAVTAGIGSDHVDLNAANKTNGGVTVAEVTGSNVVSVAEHVVMTMLVLVRNFVLNLVLFCSSCIVAILLHSIFVF